MLTDQVQSIIRKAAQLDDLPEAALLAIIDTESNGEVFWNVDGKLLPAIRWEGHYFHKRLTGAKLDRAVREGLADPKAGGVANPRSYAARYALLERARDIDEDAANESVSWGMGQVMGANWRSLGYRSVAELVKAAHTAEGQVDMMVRYLRTNNLFVSIRALEWETVARVYNGPAYKKNAYDTKMEAAYARFNNGDNTPEIATDETKQMQNMLNYIGDYKLVVDGIMGGNTTLALRDFQLKNGLVVDGKYGPISKETLQRIYVTKSKEKDITIGGSAGGIGTAGTVLTEAAKQLEPMAKTSQVIQIVFVLIMLVGIFFTIKPFIWKK